MAEAQTSLLNRLAKSLDGEKATATFACGGTQSKGFLDANKQEIVPLSNPILFYEDKKGECHKVTFPATAEEMEKLASHCDPASFGVGEVETMDTEYRSAWKLDNTKFATSFHPLDCDIMEVVKKLLFPGAIKLDPLQPIVIAELYKLNIYKGPHDKFKPHVDTPRSKQQFGSLVVCLPCAHTGGELAVRHDGREVTFDWSKDAKHIQWAAFYSDCEHEVLPVTSGYRVTLTYNLYYNNIGDKVPDCPNWRASVLPLYQDFSEILQLQDFMPEGGVLGIYCHHNYVHTTNDPHLRLPKMMKGADAALYSVCLALNLKTQARPVYITSNSYYEDEEYDDYGDDEEDDWPPKRQKLNPESLFPGVKVPPLPPKDKVNDDWIGDKFRIITPNEYMGDLEQSLLERLEREEWLHEYKGIQWVNEPKHKEANRCYMTYGNEPGMGLLYSAAALFILVPKWDEKRGVTTSS